MATDFRIDPRDRETYGGPEWVTFDREALDDVAFDQLNRWERAIGISIVHLLTVEFPKVSALGVKGVVWLGRQMSGITEPGFGEFNIRTRLVRHRPSSGDADPPSNGSSEP